MESRTMAWRLSAGYRYAAVLAFVAALAAAIALTRWGLSGPAFTKGAGSMTEQQGIGTAPDFPDGMEWLNTDRPLSLRDLRGKVVLLDFWTYCCINCMHVIPDLKRLEKKYAQELVVIGVHSAKFIEERDTDNIRQAILRYGIEHPVVNDHEMVVWRQYGVDGWPTLVLIDPAGTVAASISGEGIYQPMDRAIAGLIQTFDARGQIDRRPLRLRLESKRVRPSLLSFPGKVLADQPGGRLFIADSNHNRIVVVSLAGGTVADVIGGGEVGLADGDFEHAMFNHPQGMALDRNSLYVADTENHAIRRVDLRNRTVTTIAGTGEQDRGFSAGGAARETALNSPWDLVLRNGTLYIAMAGSHQIWRMDMKTGQAIPHAGTGREARIDAPLAYAALAQPSGITTDGSKLYFADSEVSSIRSADLAPNGRVQTIAGGDLFDFGDRDDEGLKARFQHPLGVAYHAGYLYVADTYNNKIKRISPRDGTSETLLGTGRAGLDDGERATFYEPGGLSVADGKLFIADTNNHAIRVADLETRRVEMLQIRGLQAARPRPMPAFAGQVIQMPAQAVSPGTVALTISLQLSPGYKLNAQAPSYVKAESSQRQFLTLGNDAALTVRKPSFPITAAVQASDGRADLSVDFALYYCRDENESLCYFKEARVVVPVKVQEGTNNDRLSVSYELPGER
jgi:thiol-disulfide isomerase/thioredoxin/sugar lactone lactonase YvrE